MNSKLLQTGAFFHIRNTFGNDIVVSVERAIRVRSMRYMWFCMEYVSSMSLVTRKRVSGVFDQVRLKQACATPEAS